MARRLAVREGAFERVVLAASTPMLVLFGSPACAASRRFAQLLLAQTVGDEGRLGLATVSVEAAPLLAEQYYVAVAPTLLVFSGGEVLTRVIGFVPPGLLSLLLAALRSGELRREHVWSPVEERLEATVVLPLLDAAGLHYRRQVACTLPEGSATKKGRIDVLVTPGPGAAPCLLIECKRRLLTPDDLRRATAQGLGYARALDVPCFLVAAPAGLWAFRRHKSRALPEAALSSFTIEQQPDLATGLLQQLAR